MSRVAKNPIQLPAGVEVNIDAQFITIKGSKGSMIQAIPSAVKIVKEEKTLQFSPVADVQNADALAGTIRALVQAMVEGVSRGFERKLTLVGVGYRAQVQGKKLNLTLGHSHPINFTLPEGITVDTPSQTEVIVKGVNKQLVGLVAAKIRALRSPEPYKGKGVRYANEVVILKEVKKQ
jgi:large subunit ribosomal protein L6